MSCTTRRVRAMTTFQHLIIDPTEDKLVNLKRLPPFQGKPALTVAYDENTVRLHYTCADSITDLIFDITDPEDWKSMMTALATAGAAVFGDKIDGKNNHHRSQ